MLNRKPRQEPMPRAVARRILERSARGQTVVVEGSVLVSLSREKIYR